MKLVGRIPIEPLDDERMTNIERRIVTGAADAAARPAPRESRMHLVVGFAMVTVLVLGAGLAGWYVRGGAGVTTVTEVEPLTIRTDDKASTIDIGDARITSSPSSVYTITRPDGGVLVSLARGKVALEVGKRGDRAPLVVRAGDTDVVVIGTQFSVDFPREGDVDVRVTEGVVKVVRNQKETRVAAGQAWQTERGLVALATIRDVDTHADDIEIEIEDPKIALNNRTAKIPDARITTKGKPNGQNGGSNGSNTTTRIESRPRLDNLSDPYFDLKTAVRRQTVLPPADVGITDPNAAIAKYRETTGADASHALYSVAYLQYMKLNRPADALQTLERYRSRFQGGAEYQAALWMRVRILCLANLDETCREAAHTYIAASSSGKAREVAERITTSQ